MSPRLFLEGLSTLEQVSIPAAQCRSDLDIPALNALALRSVVSLFEEKEKLFSRRITLTDDGIRREGISRKRTIIALLGLQRLVKSGEPAPVDLASIRAAVLGDTSWVSGLGDLGLLLWFTAECAPEGLEGLLNKWQLETALESYADGHRACSKGLAWFLAGLGHARLACSRTLPDLTDIAVDTYHLLLGNQSECAIFGHAGLPGFFDRPFSKRFGTFADQIYAIYALTTFARAFDIEEPLESALSCANALRALQGEMGQWWFLYDRHTCRVSIRYPVLSFQQDGIAPVGLLALEEATGQNFWDSICKGLSWVAGANELGCDLRNQEQGLIWDSVGPNGRLANYCEAALSFLNVSPEPRPENLRIRHEARPDHFGWLLYAFGKFGLPKASNSS